MKAALDIPNRDARRLWLAANGLSGAPAGPVDVPGMIAALGLLQLDTIRNVTRAHNHILWSRNHRYREGMLWPHLASRALFEHFTHDASLLPVSLLPLWQVQFRRLGARAARGAWYQSGLTRAEIEAIRARIEQEGPLSTQAFETRTDSRAMWARPPHKKVLDQLWYAGDLATAHRQNFVKFYDLGARIWDEAGFVDAFSLSHDWVAESRLAIDQAPIVIGLENHRSGLVWRLVSGRPEVRRGLTALGFTAPWLDARIV